MPKTRGKIIILITLILVTFLRGNNSFGELATKSKTLGLYDGGNERPTGYYTVNKKDADGNLPVIKIVEYTSGGNSQDGTKSDQVIYCLKDGIGFGATDTTMIDVSSNTQEYTNYFNMRKTIDDGTYRDQLPQGEDYNKLMWLLDNICIPEDENSVQKLLDAAGINKDEFGELIGKEEEFKDVIEVIQQSAIWYITNIGEEDSKYRPSENPVFKVADDVSYPEGQNIETKYGMDEEDSAVNKLYNYLITKAEENNEYQYDQTQTYANLNKMNAQIIKGEDCFYVGPYNIDGPIENITSATVTINGESSIDLQLVDLNFQIVTGEDLTAQLKTLLNEEFYIRMPLEAQGKPIRFNIELQYSKKNIEYWSTTKNEVNSSQPVVIIDNKTITKRDHVDAFLPDLVNVRVTKTWNHKDSQEKYPTRIEVELIEDGIPTGNIQELNADNNWSCTFENLEMTDEWGTPKIYTVIENNIPENYKSSITQNDETGLDYTITNTYLSNTSFDLALRKFITKVNDREVEKLTDAGTGDKEKTRVPEITQEDLKELAGKTDTENAFDNGTTTRKKHTKSSLAVRAGDKITYTIRIYNEGQIDGYADEITDYLPEGLELVPNEESEINKIYRWKADDNNSKIVRTDYLSQAQEKEGNNLIKKFNENPQNDEYVIDYKDVEIECRVIEPLATGNLKNVAEITKDSNSEGVEDRDSTPENLNDNYKGDNYNSATSTEGKGYEDDDDYEELTLYEMHDTFDLSLRKFITGVNDKVLKTGDRYDREPNVDATPLLEGGETALYKHTKETIKVEAGDIVTYTIRVYNEGNLSGYAEEITDYLPPELEFLPDDELNKKYLWEIDASGRTVKTKYLSQIQNDDNAGDSLWGDSSGDIVDNILRGFDGGELDYKDVQVRCKVKDTAEVSKRITNIAEITETCNEYNILDRDNKNKVGLPQDEDLPDYKGKDSNPKVLANNEYYYEGQEDDDDFEKLVIERFDLALRKFITGVNDQNITDREPEVDASKYGTVVDGKEITEMEYRHTKEPVRVSHNDIVIYTIRVYNEGTKAGYAAEIKDDIPEGLEYILNNAINNEYGWVLYDKDGNETTDVKEGATIRTDYLSKEKEEIEGENLLQGFDKETMNPIDYRDVKVAFRVTMPNTDDRIVTNHAEISKDTDENGEEVEDVDSIPNEWNGEDDEDEEHIYVKYFDLSLKKWVSQVILVEDGIQKEMDTGHKPEQNPEPVVKVELNKKKIENATIKFRYQIRVTNEGEIEGYATEISDYIPDGLKFNQADNPEWKEEDEKIVTNQLKDTLLQPGESTIIDIVLTWVNDAENLNQKLNVAEICEAENPSDTPDKDSTPNNKKDGEDDIDDAPVVLTVVTGRIPLYISLVIGIVVVIGIGIIIIKKYVI